MSPQEQTERIEAWLDDRMTEAERALFETQLQGDEALAAEVALHRALREAAREEALTSFRGKVDAFLAAEESTIASPPLSARTGGMRSRSIPQILLALAATLVLVLAAVWFFKLRQPALSPEDLYAAAFQPPAAFYYAEDKGKSTGALRGSGDSTLNRWSNINKVWAAGQADQALRLALEITQQDTSIDNRRAGYYMAGVISLAQNQAAQSLQYLEKARGVDLYSEDIPWYLALAHYKLAMKDPAHHPLAEAALKAVLAGKQPAPRHEQAEKMLRVLKRASSRYKMTK